MGPYMLYNMVVVEGLTSCN